MNKKLLIIFLLFLQIVFAEPLLNKTVTLEPGASEVVSVEATQAVKVYVEFKDTAIKELLDCKNCLHLSQRMSDGFIPQTNSSNIGVGFQKVMPENGKIEVIVSHDHKTSKKIEITIDTTS